MSLDKPKVLAIDDEPKMLSLVERALSRMDFEVASAASGEQGLAQYAADAFDLVLLDIVMPQMDGIEVLEHLRAQDAEVPVIIMSGHSSIDSAVRAMKAGAEDYLTKPLDLEHLEVVLTRALRTRQERTELRVLREQVADSGSFHGMVGVSPPMRSVYELVRRLAPSDTSVLIQGETGTGKELVARALHNLGPRREQGFMAINCGALPESILESELFGHEKGAFTGAVKQKYGLIEQAEGGTLFLDEIEEMSPALQVKVLRAIQEREVLRVGGDGPISVDFRLIAAANADLRQRMEGEAFRADLFYRLSVATIDLPPLRQRPGDIPLLARHFAARCAEKNGQPVRQISPEAMMVLRCHAWPGNVRELENVIEQGVVLGEGGRLTAEELPPYLTGPVSGTVGPDFCDLPFKEARAGFERHYFEEQLNRAGGQVAEAAQRAGMPRQYFYEKMKRLEIPRARPPS